MKFVAVVPDPGVTPPLDRVLEWPPPVVHDGTAITAAANGALKLSTIATTSDGTSRLTTDWRARRDVSTQNDRSQDPLPRRWAVGPVEFGPNG